MESGAVCVSVFELHLLKTLLEKVSKSNSFYAPMMEKKDAVMRNAYRTLIMLAMVIWMLGLATKQMMM